MKSRKGKQKKAPQKPTKKSQKKLHIKFSKSKGINTMKANLNRKPKYVIDILKGVKKRNFPISGRVRPIAPGEIRNNSLLEVLDEYIERYYTINGEPIPETINVICTCIGLLNDRRYSQEIADAINEMLDKDIFLHFLDMLITITAHPGYKANRAATIMEGRYLYAQDIYSLLLNGEASYEHLKAFFNFFKEIDDCCQIYGEFEFC